VVVDHSTPVDELERAFRLVGEIDRRIPFVLQPEDATFSKSARGADARKRLLSLLEIGQQLALRDLDDVRVIPQCHKMLMVR
jgi:hypothetical protein